MGSRRRRLCVCWGTAAIRGSLPSSQPTPWPDIFAGAVPSNDDHVIKMVYTCHRESTRYGNPLYQAAAARLVAVGKTE